jgi:hypothetical protein
VKRAWLVVAVAAVGGAAWWALRPERGSAATGVVTLEWRGTDRGAARLPAKVSWCPVTRIATLSAISTDTGLLVTLHEVDSMRTGPHPVVSPALRDVSPRPSATAALRWVKDTSAILGYASVSGMVNMSAVGTAASGSMEVRFRKPATLDTIVLRADFRDVPVVASAVGCP